MTPGTEAARPSLAVLPTPLHPAPRLSEELGAEVWLKRDDMTGLGLGGNKARPLQFLLEDARGRGADHLVTGGGPASNWVLLAALGARQWGLRVEAVLFGDGRGPEPGCLRLLRRLPGVEITFTGEAERSSVDPLLEERAEQVRKRGGVPYVAERGGASPTGALGYARAVSEINGQLAERETEMGTVWLAAGSCGTQAGLVAGHSHTGAQRFITGVTVHRPPPECRRRIARISAAALDLLPSAPAARTPVEWEVVDGLRPDPAGVRAAVRLMAEAEGIFLDDEFGGPALAMLAERAGETAGPVLFLVTGGAPGLFNGGPGDEHG